MGTLARRYREREPGQMSRLDPFRALGDMFRWDPFAEMDLSPRRGEAMFSPDIELKETPEALVLKVDLPGMRQNDVDISIVGNRLIISGRREEEVRREDEQFFAYEREYGAFARTFLLPDTYDSDQVKAELKDGVLTVVVSKRPGAQARHVPVMSQGQEQRQGATQARSTTEGQGGTAGRGGAQGERREGGTVKIT